MRHSRLDCTYGVSDDKLFYEPAATDVPTEDMWSTSKYLLHVPKLFDALRDKFGEDIELLHDAHHRLTPIEAGRLGKMLEPHHLLWLEDAVAAENQESYRIIRQHTTTPLAIGEIFSSIWDGKTLIDEQLIDYIRATVTHAGGITHLRAHCRSCRAPQCENRVPRGDRSIAVSMGSALHFDLWVPNFGIQEYMRHTEETDAVFPHDYSFADGYLHPGDKPWSRRRYR